MVRRTLPLFALLAPLLAEAAAPPLIPITGYLTDATGAPIDGSQTLHLKLYDASGAQLWTENQTVDVDNGQFTAYLGDVTTVDLATFRDNGALFLGVAVGTGSEMVPRFELATAPFAGYAQYCDDADTVGGIDPADLLQVGDAVNWLDIAGRPPGLDDGDDDDDTTYTNGPGLNVSGTQFSVDQPTIEGWAQGVAFDSLLELQAQLDTVYMANQSCTVNQLLLADSSGAFVCVDAAALPLSEAAVDAAVANNGYAFDAALATVSATVSAAEGNIATLQTTVGNHTTSLGTHTSQIATLTTGLATTNTNLGTTNTNLATTNTNLATLTSALTTPGTINTGSNPVDFTKLKNVPALQYRTGAAGTLMTCPVGQHIRVIAPDGTATCAGTRVIHVEDSFVGCPGTRPVNTDMAGISSAFALTAATPVQIHAQMIRNRVGRGDLQLFVDGVFRDQTLTYTSSAQWEDADVNWTGVLGAGNHTVTLRSPDTTTWGCGPSWGSMDTVIFE